MLKMWLAPGRRVGFTLIELLIVVAIIAILAAIAVPNFLEAQVRAKVARCKADFRAIDTGLHAYYIDTNKFPKGNNSSRVFNPVAERALYRRTLERLTSPVSYLTGEGAFYDPFKAKKTYQGASMDDVKDITQYPGQEKNFQLYWYAARNEAGHSIWDQPGDTEPKWFILEGAGPDGFHHNSGTFFNTLLSDSPANRGKVGKMLYDATNGTVSRGSIWRVGGTPVGEATSFYYMVQQQNG